MQACYDITLAVEIPGGGASLHRAGCHEQGSQSGTSTGSTTEASFLGGDCASAEPGPIFDGIATSTLTQNACCEQDFDLRVAGITYGQPFGFVEPSVGQTQANVASCPCLPLLTTENFQVPPGDSGMLQVFTVQNLDTTNTCTFDYQVSKTGGTPTVNLPHPAGSVTLPPMGSQAVEIEVDVPANNTAADDAEIGVVVAPRGYPLPMMTGKTAKICLVPRWETSTFLRWDNVKYPMGDVAIYEVGLLPGTTDFSGRYFSEAMPETVEDTCHLVLPTVFRVRPFQLQAGTPIEDSIGTTTSLDGNGLPPCYVEKVVPNQINCFGTSLKDQVPFARIPILLDAPNKTFIERDGIRTTTGH